MIGDALSDGAVLAPPTEADGIVGEKLRSLSLNGVSAAPIGHDKRQVRVVREE